MPHVIVKLWSGLSELLAEREKVHGQATAAAIERVALTKTWVVYRAAAPTILQLFLICGDSRASPSEASPRRPSIGYARAGACTKRRGAETSGPRPPISSARRRASSPWQAFPGRGGGLSHQLLAGPGQCAAAVAVIGRTFEWIMAKGLFCLRAEIEPGSTAMVKLRGRAHRGEEAQFLRSCGRATKGQQTVRVEHVTVQAGGQAHRRPCRGE